MNVKLTNGQVIFTYERGTSDIPVALELLHSAFVANKKEVHRQYIAKLQTWLVIHQLQDRNRV